MISIKEILNRPLFRCAELLAGKNGIGRTVGWVHIVDIKNAGLYINRDDLILSTGLGLVGTSEAERKEYLKDLVQNGVAGLCIELGDYFEQLPADMVTMADEHNFPLIVFTKRVRFVEITQDIHSLLVNTQLEVLRNLTAFSQELQRLTVQSTGISPILAALHRYTSHQIIFYYPSGVSLFAPAVEPSAGKHVTGLYQDALAGQHPASPLGAVLQLDAQRFLLSQPVTSMGQTAAYLGLLMNGEKVSESLLMALDYAVKSITSFLLRRLFLEEKKMESQNQFIQEIINGTVTDEEQALEQLGFPPSSPHLFIAGIVYIEQSFLRYEGESIESIYQDIVLLSRSLLGKQRLHALLMLRGKKLYVLCIAKKKGSLKIIKNQLEAFIIQFQQALLHMFEEQVKTITGFGQAKEMLILAKESFEEAEETVKVNQSLPHSSRFFYEDLGLYQLPLKIKNTAFIPSFITVHIGPLLDYDEQNNSQLVETLRIYLKHMGSKQLAAQELFIHRQTLYHRLERCKELLGDNYLEPEKRLCIEAAITFYAFSGREPG